MKKLLKSFITDLKQENIYNIMGCEDTQERFIDRFLDRQESKPITEHEFIENTEIKLMPSQGSCGTPEIKAKSLYKNHEISQSSSKLG